ncbi:unnamed protein product [Ambrosiozyma monospora]|uniref:Unnamed protein product n=1 Tax=Ambrosiozyma monospora TaxID=43982 RepID=A0A9W6YPL4_AMBMO|nr:unnamed protein product [Ambrosiozyma monospora]
MTDQGRNQFQDHQLNNLIGTLTEQTGRPNPNASVNVNTDTNNNDDDNNNDNNTEDHAVGLLKQPQQVSFHFSNLHSQSTSIQLSQPPIQFAFYPHLTPSMTMTDVVKELKKWLSLIDSTPKTIPSHIHEVYIKLFRIQHKVVSLMKSTATAKELQIQKIWQEEKALAYFFEQCLALLYQ